MKSAFDVAYDYSYFMNLVVIGCRIRSKISKVMKVKLLLSISKYINFSHHHLLVVSEFF